MTRESYRRQVEEQLEEARRSSDPDAHKLQWLQELLMSVQLAEEALESDEKYLATAIDAMRRRELARRAARRAREQTAVIEDEDRAERTRLRRNARARARSRQRRFSGAARTDHRTGMHAIAIAVDPAAYAAVKLEAYEQRTTIPALIGEIILSDLEHSEPHAATFEPRWQRTGEGRRANQHTRIDIADKAWDVLHIDALRRSLTVGRRIGLAIEDWAAFRGPDKRQ